MILRVRHRLAYRYAAPAVLGPQVLRLRPRHDGAQRLLDHSLRLDPQPSLRSACLDENGNVDERAWFVGATPSFEAEAESTVETLRRNPYDFVIAAGHASLPWGPDLARDRPTLGAALSGGPEPEAAELASRTAAAAGGDALAFLMRLNRALHESLGREKRPHGPARSAGETLRLGRGACRDLAVVFCAAARSQGMPARFVSGYHEDDPSRRAKDLHAWAEVFLPGAGWRGFDPNTGLACGEFHVALAAGPDPADASPLEGRFGSTDGQSTLETEVLFL